MNSFSSLQTCQNLFTILWRICQALFWRTVIYSRHYYLLLTNPEYNPATIPKPSNDEVYATKYVKKFQATFEDGYNVNVNENVHRVFYDAKELASEVEVKNNELEMEWRRRVLQETTPRGNVVMYYDPFRLAFVYYADTHIPYTILNAVAMRYVLMYRCRDLFVDEFLYPPNHISPLISILIQPQKPTAPEKHIRVPSNIKNAPFAKLKSAKDAGAGVSETTASNKQKHMNVFICLGKLMDFPLFQITKPKPKQVSPEKKCSYAEFMKSKTASSMFSDTYSLSNDVQSAVSLFSTSSPVLSENESDSDTTEFEMVSD